MSLVWVSLKEKERSQPGAEHRAESPLKGGEVSQRHEKCEGRKVKIERVRRTGKERGEQRSSERDEDEQGGDNTYK